MLVKTSKKDFELFKKEFLRWQNTFQLNDWKVDFVHEKSDGGERASIARDIYGRRATVFFNRDWDASIEPLTPQAIKETAKHEAIHLLLSRVILLGKQRFVDENSIYEAEEELIGKLINLL